MVSLKSENAAGFRQTAQVEAVLELAFVEAPAAYHRFHADLLGHLALADFYQPFFLARLCDGSLRRVGNRVRFTVQLVETRTGHSIWAERYDRELKDIFDVQDDIGRSIAQALRITLTPQEEGEIARKPTDNPQAYDYYLRGRSYARRCTRPDLEFALQMYEHAIA